MGIENVPFFTNFLLKIADVKKDLLLSFKYC